MGPRFRTPEDAEGADSHDDKAASTPPDRQGEMIDLPLGGSSRPGARIGKESEGRARRRAGSVTADRPASAPPAAAAGVGSQFEDPVENGGPGVDRSPPARHPTSATARSRPSGRRWLWVLALVLVAAAIGYFLPSRGAPVVSLSTPLLDFSSLRVGEFAETLEVVVTNTGEREMLIEAIRIEEEAADDYLMTLETCIGRPLLTGETCSIEVGFQPQSADARQARLVIAGNASNSPFSLPLTGIGTAPRLAVDRTRIGFEAQPVGERSEPAVLTLTNRGSAPLEVAAMELEGDAAAEFERRGDGCTGKRLEAGEGCSLQLIFAPRLTGERTAALRIRADGSGPPVLVRLSGVAEAGALGVDAPAEGVDFGLRTVGVSGEPHRLTWTNNGEELLKLGRISLADGEAGFALLDETCSSAGLEAGATCTVDIAFTPSAEGAVEDALQVAVAGGRGTVLVPLSGVGESPPIRIVPASIDFGAVAVGESAAPQSVRIGNAGSTELELTGLAIVGDGLEAYEIVDDGCAGVKLASGDRCEVGVLFRPEMAGARSGRLEVTSRERGAVGGVALNGTGVAAVLSVSDERLDFGRVAWGKKPLKRITLRNEGNSVLVLRRIEIVGDPSGDYRLDRSTCSAGGSLKPGVACGVGVRLVAMHAGDRVARLRLQTNAAGGAVELPLRARVSEPPVPKIAVSPAVLDFGRQTVGERSGIRTVVVRSPGSGRLVLGDLRLEGEHSRDFYLVPGSCQGVEFVAPQGECTIGFRFYPKSGGERRARLVIPHNAEGGTLAVPLVGQASDQ